MYNRPYTVVVLGETRPYKAISQAIAIYIALEISLLIKMFLCTAVMQIRRLNVRSVVSCFT
jgi:hypothetical protein